MTKQLDKYVTLARKTLVIPISIMKTLTKIESNMSWYNQRIVYGKIFALGILAFKALNEEQTDDIVRALEDNSEADKAEDIFRHYITSTAFWGEASEG